MLLHTQFLVWIKVGRAAISIYPVETGAHPIVAKCPGKICPAVQEKPKDFTVLCNYFVAACFLLFTCEPGGARRGLGKKEPLSREIYSCVLKFDTRLACMPPIQKKSSYAQLDYP